MDEKPMCPKCCCAPCYCELIPGHSESITNQHMVYACSDEKMGELLEVLRDIVKALHNMKPGGFYEE